jgi:cell volume regulation protein A
MDVEALDLFLLVGGLVVVAAILAVRFAIGVGLPSLLVYLAIGLVIGESGLGIQFEDAGMARAVSFAALVVILAEGGLTTPWRVVRPALPLGIALATIGVGVSTLVIAVVAHTLLGFDWTLAVLLGAVFAPTDAAAVFSTLRRVPLTRRVAATLEAESGLNDAPVIVLVVLLSTGQFAEQGLLQPVLVVLYELAAGSVIGLAVGALGVGLLRRAALPASGLYPLAVMTFAVLGYAVPAAVHASGFVGVYVAALVLGNSDLPHRVATRSFAEGLAWLAQIGLFVMLGLLSSPGRLGPAIVPALVAGTALLFLARPISVAASALPFRLPWQEQAFLSWAGLRGAVPVVFATIPLSESVDGATRLFDVVFVFVIVFTFVQAPPLPWLAARLGVATREAAREVEMEVAPLAGVDADLVQARVTGTSRIHGVTVQELRLPTGASVALVVRAGDSFVPGPASVLRHGDELLVVAPRRLREETERRLQEVSQHGRLARWLGASGRRPTD